MTAAFHVVREIVLSLDDTFKDGTASIKSHHLRTPDLVNGALAVLEVVGYLEVRGISRSLGDTTFVKISPEKLVELKRLVHLP